MLLFGNSGASRRFVSQKLTTSGWFLFRAGAHGVRSTVPARACRPDWLVFENLVEHYLNRGAGNT